MAVHPLFPANSIPEFIAYAKANPNKIDLATGGIGTVGHIYGEMVKINPAPVARRPNSSAVISPELTGGKILPVNSQRPSIKHNAQFTGVLN